LRDLSLSSARFSKPTQSSQREIAFTSAESTIPKLLNLFAARAWSGVTGTTFNATAYPGLVAPLARVAAQNSCSDDAEDYVDGLNTICFNQSSDGFTTGVLAFTRTITANAVGVTVGSSAPAQFVGQILDSDTLFRNDGQAIYATPAAFANAQGQGAYDLESLLTHELGHWLGLDHSGVFRAIMFPLAPPPGQFIGDRPTPTTPDGRLPTMTAPPRVSSTLIPTIP
jgi:Matrixin